MSRNFEQKKRGMLKKARSNKKKQKGAHGLPEVDDRLLGRGEAVVLRVALPLHHVQVSIVSAKLERFFFFEPYSKFWKVLIIFNRENVIIFNRETVKMKVLPRVGGRRCMY